MADKLLLFDGNALVHRAYHALPPLTSPDGVLVNAVYGFMVSVLSAIALHEPKYVAVAFDVAGKTFRNELYSEYKATRQKADQALYDQIPIIQKLLQDMNVPIYGVAGFEADDVLATIAKEAKGLETIIVTGDNDVLQLVNDRVRVYSVSRGVKLAVTYDARAVEDRYGIPPELLVDYKALAGDPSDNVKGLPGIGPKRASELVREYGSVENILQKVPELKKFEKELLLAKKIVTLVDTVPLTFNVGQARLTDYDAKKVAREFAKLGFKSLFKRLPQPTQEQLFS
ncbi:MAG: 5'-3' exonuclease H3TH domain-containing protein [Patescibacteria group bacterium]